MTSDEKPAFMKILSTLFGAHGKPLSESMINGYWKGLERMSLIEFERCCDAAIAKLEHAERGASKTPTVAELWDIRRGFRRLPSAPASVDEPKFLGDHWDIAANHLLMAYISDNWRKRDPIDYAPDSYGYPVKTGPHTEAIAKILHSHAKQWAEARRADERENVKSDGRIEWLSYMTHADKAVTNYIALMRKVA